MKADMPVRPSFLSDGHIGFLLPKNEKTFR